MTLCLMTFSAKTCVVGRLFTAHLNLNATFSLKIVDTYLDLIKSTVGKK